MSRTAVRGFGLFIVGQIAVFALLLCLFAQKGYAQFVILPEWVGRGTGGADYNGIVFEWDWRGGDWYYYPTALFPWQLQLSDQNHTGGIRLRSSTAGSYTLRFDGSRRGSDPLSLSGGAIFIYEANRFDFSADYAHTSPETNGAFFLTPALRSALIFENNSTTMNGGAISITRTEVNFINVRFNNNHTVSLGTTTTQGGGAIHNVGGRLSFTDAGFGDRIFRAHMYQPGLNNHNVFTYRGGSSNTSAQSGGAIHSTGGSLTFNANAAMSISTTASATGVITGGTHDNQGVPGPVAARIPTYTPGITSLTSTRSNMTNRSDHDRAELVPWSRSLTNVWALAQSVPGGNPGNAWFDAINATQTANTFIDNRALDGYGGAIFAIGTDMDFTARAAAVANATGTAAASSTGTGDNPIARDADAYAETLVNVFGYGGYFERNTATISGGAIYTQNGTLTFEARDTSATANATATANAGINTTNTLGDALSLARAEAYADARAGYFVNNEALGNRAQDGGGAIYNLDGTLNFTVRAVTSTATASATATPITTGTGATSSANDAWAEAYAYSWAYAAGGYFENNRARHGGALYSTGTLNFNAAASVNATSNASAAATDVTAGGAGGATGLGDAFSYAGGGFARAFGGYFVDNVARMGGAIFNDGTLTARTADGMGESWHDGNSGPSSGNGGGSWTEYWAYTDLAATRFDDNRATTETIGATTYGGLGGAIYNTRNGALEFFGRSVFYRNVAELDGGIIYNDGGTVLFDSGGWWIQHMERNYAGRHGGAIYNTNDGTVTINQSSIYRSGFDIDPLNPGLFNSSRVTITQRGGAIYNDDGVLDLGALYHTAYLESAVRFRGNSAVLTGGAIHNTKDGIVDLLGVTFDNNIAEVGGAIYNAGGELNVNGGRNADGTPWRRPNGQHYSLFAGNGIEEIDLGGNTRTLRGGAIFNTHGIATGITGAPIIDPSTGEPTILVGRLTSDNTRFQFNQVLETGGALHNTEHGTFTFTEVSFVSNIAELAGGAVWNAGTGFLTDSRFVQNSDGALTGGVGGNGGAIFNTETGTLTFTNVAFLGNIASQGIVPGTGQGSGGAIYNQGGELIFSDVAGDVSNFFANKAYYGGAIFNDGATLTMEGSRFGSLSTITEIAEAGSNTARFGGAIFNTNRLAPRLNPSTGLPIPGQYDLVRGVVDLTDVLFEGNQATDVLSALSGTGLGGAIYNEVGLVTLEGVTFNANTAHLHGGAIYHSSLDRSGNSVMDGSTAVRGVLTLTDVDFRNNVATTGRGGAIYSQGGSDVAVINLNVSVGETSTFSGNRRNTAGTAVNESIFFSGRNEFNVHIDATEVLSGGSPALDDNGRPIATNVGLLEMFDPMGGNGTVAIRQTGLGTWLLTGNSDFSAGTNNTFTVEEGTLRFQLYNYGTSTPNWMHTTLDLGGGASSRFQLNPGATLSIGQTAITIAGVPEAHGSTIRATTIDLNGTLEFHLTEEDVKRTRSTPRQAVLTLTGTNVTVGGNVNVWLTGTDLERYLDSPANPSDPSMNWEDWFMANLNTTTGLGSNYIYIIGAGASASIDPEVVDVWMRATDSDEFEKYRASRVVSGSGAHVLDFVAEFGELRVKALVAEQWEVQWTGRTNNVWDTLTQNWYGTSGGGWTERFYTGDHARFTDDPYSYIDETGVQRSGNPGNRSVVLNSNVGVSSMDVTGTGYSFRLASGITLAATAHGTTGGRINFGNSTVRVLSDATGSTTTIAASGAGNRITFGSETNNAGSRLEFDLSAGVDSYKSAPTTPTNGNPPILRLTTGDLTVNRTNGFMNIVQAPSVFVNNIANLNVGQRITFIEATGHSSVLENIRLGIYVGGQEYITRRAASGVVHRFVRDGNRLNLVGEASPAGGYDLEWTGRNAGTSNVWNNSTVENWLGNYTGNAPPNHLAPIAYTFRDGDQVSFSERFRNESGAWETVVNRNVAITDDVRVFSMNVSVDANRPNYRFTLGNNKVLAATEGIGFGSAIVEMGAGSRITATNDRIAFGSTITGAATIHAASGAEIVAPIINFTGDSDFYFDMTNVGVGSILTLRGNVNVFSEIGAVGGGHISLSERPDLAAGEKINLIKIVGTGTVTPTGTLMIGNTPDHQRRSTNPLDTMLGLKAENNDKELWLMVADASAQAEIYWTGVNNMDSNDSMWSADQNNNANNTNWKGETTEGVGVHSFLRGDRVIFGDTALGTHVTNKVVNVVAGGVTVASMNVTGTGYTFDLRQGGITASANASPHANATGTGNINFGRDTTIISGVGSVVNARGTNGGTNGANGTITFGTDTTFRFDLSNANANSTLLTLNGNVSVPSTERIGSGDIYVSNLSTTGRIAGDRIILVDAGANNPGVVTNTGDLYRTIGGSTTLHSPTRSTTANAPLMFGLAVNDEDAPTQLLLKWVNPAGLSDNLVWAGKDPTQIREGRNTYNFYIWGATSESNSYANWRGQVEGVSVDTFLHGDTVRFNNAANQYDVAGNGANRYVVINDGGVRVNSMFVDAPGYFFDLMGGGGMVGRRFGERGTLNNIEAAGRVDLGASTIVVGIDYNAAGELVTGQIIAQGDITVNGASVNATVLVENVDFAEVIRLEHDGVLDLDILVSEEGTVVNNGGRVNVNMAANPFYDSEFIIDEERGSRFGTLRLSYFRYANLARSLGLSHNETEAGKALDFIRHIRTGDSAADEQFRRWIGANHTAAMNVFRGTELVANSLSMAMWRPWEITHQRTRNVQEESGWNSWGSSYYRFGNTSSDGNARKYDLYRGGAMIGADYGSNRYWQFGGAFGYGLPKIQGSLGKVEADDLTLGAYSKINYFDQAWVSSFIGYGHQRYNMTRRGVFEDHLSKYGGDAWYASVEFVRPITVSIVTVMPLVALDHQTAWTKSFSESGYWGQTMAGTSMDRTMVRFGVDSKIVGIGGSSAARVDLATRLQAAFLVDGDKKATVVSHFPLSGASMTLHGVDIGWGQINAGLTTTGEWRQRYQWFFDVDGFLTERTTALQGQIGVSTRW